MEISNKEDISVARVLRSHELH